MEQSQFKTGSLGNTKEAEDERKEQKRIGVPKTKDRPKKFNQINRTIFVKVRTDLCNHDLSISE